MMNKLTKFEQELNKIKDQKTKTIKVYTCKKTGSEDSPKVVLRNELLFNLNYNAD